jgi:plastocyanin
MSCCSHQHECQRDCDSPCARLHTVQIVDNHFVPYQLTIRTGDSIEWVNADTGAHTVVSNPGNEIGPRNFDKVVWPNGRIRQRFCHQGLWTYYCKYDATLDKYAQPIAPGPGAGIVATPSGLQGFGDVNNSLMSNATVFACPSGCAVTQGAICCNFGTPMSGIVCVLPRRKS